MEKTMELQVIAKIQNGFKEKFGIPRQSSLVAQVTSKIVFEKAYRDANALRGLDGYSHLWLIWGFSENKRTSWSPTVKPPRLGGNTRMGVFATRSPYRPNPLGLSSVKLVKIETTKEEGTVLWVQGADLMNGTPIYDIKPYLAFTDSHPEALGGFADEVREHALQVVFPEELLCKIPKEERDIVQGILAGDPRPAYQQDAERIYGFRYQQHDIRFTVQDKRLTVCEVVEYNE
ncbi:MAG: tRNA (N6-threonylcarbamoyladenosine(37)-N6)-methyltransferase TrmO [Lachnospiraceae bacterium]|nr:tRNA (N6-threonylcarbamoyladenosine(37)-N6)-methyltransferase TrmO [Lachnospiraceae bacterium]